MATKNYMINDKWLDLDKQNIVELQSVDGELDSLKVNGSEIVTPSGKITITENGTDIDIAQYALADVSVSGGGGGSSDLTWILPEQTVTLVDQPVEVTGLRLDLIPQDTDVVPIKIGYEFLGNPKVMYMALMYLNGALNDDAGLVSIFPQDNSYYFVYTDGEEIQVGEFTISIGLF